MWIVIIQDSYSPNVFYFMDYDEAKRNFDKQVSMGVACVLAECKESNF
ncbi:hypothetical protein KFD70_11955 [Bacillus pfraonensis]|nr:hypothetical protein [Bacillus sp. TL12]MCI0767876.1 hypothetical protein [Bacillus sp. TL12]HEK9100209.1 hypothetical protein [Bacillus pseudomycoides]